MNPTYLGEIELNEDTLAHFGVKGMKWGKHLKAKLSEKTDKIRRRLKRKPNEITTNYGLTRTYRHDIYNGRSTSRNSQPVSNERYRTALWSARNRAGYNSYHKRNAYNSNSWADDANRLYDDNFKQNKSFQNRARTANERAAMNTSSSNKAFNDFGITYKLDTHTNEVKRYKKKKNKSAMANDPRYR